MREERETEHRGGLEEKKHRERGEKQKNEREWRREVKMGKKNEI